MVKDRFDLSDKVALVIGGRGVLGRRFCSTFVEYGARVYSADLPRDAFPPGKAMAAHPEEMPGLEQVDVNVTSPDSVTKLVDETVARTSRIDILVYSVTNKSTDFYKPFTECSLEGWRMVLSTELDGLFLVAQKVGKVMEEAGHGSMIFLSSIYGVVGNDQRIYEGANLDQLYLGSDATQPRRIYSHAVYAAAKGGVISLTRFLSAYWGKQNIRVNCISPGGLSNPGENEEFVRRYSERVPLGRKADPDELSAAALFLASDAASYVTGHNLVVDGGWTAW
jgi:NAD(P)-dependent dehydrogenase (short-subunit alcohol dehydrogenase family)